MKSLRGIAASLGIAIGRAVLFVPRDLSVPAGKCADPEQETARLDRALALAIEELVGLKERLTAEADVELAHIFRSHQTILEDESLRQEMTARIAAGGCSAERAAADVFATYAKMFEELGEQDYNRERAADLKDVQRRLMRKLLGVEEVDLSRSGTGDDRGGPRAPALRHRPAGSSARLRHRHGEGRHHFPYGDPREEHRHPRRRLRGRRRDLHRAA